MADDSKQINQDEIESLLDHAQAAASEASAATDPGSNSVASDADQESAASVATDTSSTATATSNPQTRDPGLSEDVQVLLQQAQEALASVDEPSGADVSNISRFALRDFVGTPASSEKATLELLRDVELDLRIELGRSYMYLEDVLKLRKGAVVTLDKLAGDPVDIYANGRLIARGEVLVLNDSFCVRVAELVSGDAA